MAVPKRKQTPSRTGMRRSKNMKFTSLLNGCTTTYKWEATILLIK